MYRLKQRAEKLTMMSGPFEGKTFQHGKLYNAVPKEMADCFERVQEVAAKTPDPPVKKAPEKTSAAEPAEQKPSPKERK